MREKKEGGRGNKERMRGRKSIFVAKSANGYDEKSETFISELSNVINAKGLWHKFYWICPMNGNR